MDKSFILDRLKEFLNISTDTDLADYLGVNQSTVASWRKRNTLNVKLIIAKCNNVNAHFLNTGEGDIELNPSNNSNNIEDLANMNHDELGALYNALLKQLADKDKIIKLLEEKIDNLKDK